jgi:hypothetical protein
MEQFYYLATAIIYGIFIVRFILSWVGGDFDLDMDADGDIDLGDVVSFKGATHFLMGFFGWLATKTWTTHNIEWWDYLIAFVLGVIFVVILYYIYKFIMKLETKPNVLSGTDLIDHVGKIYLTTGKEGDFYKYVITVDNNLGTQEYPAKSLNKYQIGDMVAISGYVDANYII